MGILISTLLAVCAGAGLLIALYAMASRGWLDAGTKWYRRGPAWLAVWQLLVYAILWFIKSIQVGFEHDPQGGFHAWCGWVRRLDDLSWWTMLMGTVLAVAVITTGQPLQMSGRRGRRTRRLWAAMCMVAVVLYIGAVLVGDGTFFWQGTSQAAASIARLQIVEGILVLSHIMVSYVFVAAMVQGLWERYPWARAVALGSLVGGVLGLMGVADFVTGFANDEWKNCGFRGQTNYSNGRFWLFAGAVWWPWLIVLLVIIFTGNGSDRSKRTAPKEKSGQSDTSKNEAVSR